ncbi:hypothetical protein BH11PSE12_BH11PSE12_21390 [soil metagenome]
MFPETLLPDGALLFFCAAFGLILFTEIFGSNGDRHFSFNQTPACRKISIAFRQSPNAVQMIREQNLCIDFKWMRDADFFDRST